MRSLELEPELEPELETVKLETDGPAELEPAKAFDESPRLEDVLGFEL